MSKEEISKSYLEDTKQRFLFNTIPVQRNAMIVGSDARTNIGAQIAQKFRDLSISTVEFDRNDWDMADPAPEDFAWGDIAVFANGFTHLDWFEDQPVEKIYQTINDSLVASIVGAQSFVRATLDHPHKKYIVFIGSMAYKSVLNGSAAYCAAKAGLAHFSKCLAWELAPKNYNVFCVHPSNTYGTPMTEETIQGLMRYRGLDREAAEAYWGASLPKHKWLTGQDIAETVAFLTSGKADYLSGSQIDMAGGQR